MLDRMLAAPGGVHGAGRSPRADGQKPISGYEGISCVTIGEKTIAATFLHIAGRGEHLGHHHSRATLTAYRKLVRCGLDGCKEALTTAYAHRAHACSGATNHRSWPRRLALYQQRRRSNRFRRRELHLHARDRLGRR